VNPAKALAIDLATPSRSWGPRHWRPWPPAGSATCFQPTPGTRGGRLARRSRSCRVGLLDGVYGGLAESERDIFADPSEGAGGSTRLRLLVLRDGGLPDEVTSAGEPQAWRSGARTRCRAAARRGVRCGEIQAEGASALERLASLIAVPDFASVYLSLAHGLDPTAVPAVDEMKEFTRR
jgi:hypothetical protein